MNDAIAQELNKRFRPISDFTKGLTRTYHISMNNFYLNASGRPYKKQLLEAVYTRTIRDMIEDAIVFVDYSWENVFFTNILPKKESKKIEWGFVKDRSYQSHIILDQNKLDHLCEQNQCDVSQEDYTNCFTSLETCFQGLPKLPSVYLVVMQTFDVLAFDNYLSFIYTKALEKDGWKMDQWVRIKPPEMEHAKEAKIGIGLYSEDSFFKNSLFYLRFSGYSLAHGHVSALYDYYCDFSKVRMLDKQNESVQRNGTSYAHGQLWIDIRTGDLLRGTMEESYYALQEGEKQKTVTIRRKVLCEQA